MTGPARAGGEAGRSGKVQHREKCDDIEGEPRPVTKRHSQGVARRSPLNLWARLAREGKLKVNASPAMPGLFVGEHGLDESRRRIAELTHDPVMLGLLDGDRQQPAGRELQERGAGVGHQQWRMRRHNYPAAL